MLPDPCHLKKRSVRLQILLFDCRVTLELETARDCSGSIFGVESTVLQTLCPVPSVWTHVYIMFINARQGFWSYFKLLQVFDEGDHRRHRIRQAFAML